MFEMILRNNIESIIYFYIFQEHHYDFILIIKLVIQICER